MNLALFLNCNIFKNFKIIHFFALNNSVYFDTRSAWSHSVFFLSVSHMFSDSSWSCPFSLSTIIPTLKDCQITHSIRRPPAQQPWWQRGNWEEGNNCCSDDMSLQSFGKGPMVVNVGLVTLQPTLRNELSLLFSYADSAWQRGGTCSASLPSILVLLILPNQC